jgi:hypothetical protein
MNTTIREQKQEGIIAEQNQRLQRLQRGASKIGQSRQFLIKELVLNTCARCLPIVPYFAASDRL